MLAQDEKNSASVAETDGQRPSDHSERGPSTDVLFNSATYEKVPSLAPESFEQLSESQIKKDAVSSSGSSVEEPKLSADTKLSDSKPAKKLDVTTQAGM
jgi:hypothetical protein